MRHRLGFTLVFIAVVVALVSTASLSSAQLDDEPWRVYTTDQGLINNEIESIFQQDDGTIWVATQNGVGRFDGRWHNFSKDDGLISNEVYSVLQSRDQSTWWFGTQDGISELTFTSDDKPRFRTLVPEDGFVLGNVQSLLETRDGAVWFGGQDNLLVFRRATSPAWTRFSIRDGLPSGTIHALFEAADGSIWVAATDGVAIYNGQSWRSLLPPEKIPLQNITDLLVDTSGNFWFATSGFGIIQFSQKTGNWAQLTEAGDLLGNDILSLEQDKKGRYWFGTKSQGVVVFDPQKAADDERWIVGNTRNTKISSDMVMAIHADNADDTIWIGTSAGLDRYGWTSWNPVTLSAGQNWATVNALAEDPQGRIWVGHDASGLLVRDNNIWQIVPVRLGSRLVDPNVTAIHFDARGRLWIGTEKNGVFVRQNGVWAELNSVSPLRGASVRAIVENASGNFWFATSKGLIEFTPADNAATGKWNRFTKSDTLPNDDVLSLLFDDSGTLWAGTKTGIAELRSTGWYTQTAAAFPFPNSAVRAIEQAADGLLWFGTATEGFLRYDPSILSWIPLPKNQGPISRGIWALHKDRRGTMWVGTDTGVSRFDGLSWKTYQNDDGLPTNRTISLLEDREGTMWVGAVGGLSYYRADIRPPWGGFRFIDAKPVSSEPISVLANSELVVEFNGGDLNTRSEDLVYQYRLSNLSDAWQEVRSPLATFPSLSPGNYRLEMRVRDDDMNYSPPVVKEFDVSQAEGVNIAGQQISLLVLGAVFVAVLLVLGLLYLMGFSSRSASHSREALERQFNPYISGEPVRRDDLFFGRDQLIRKMLSTLHANSIMIHGERRIGKTSLLFQLQRLLDENNDLDYFFVPVFIDLEGTQESEFFHRVMDEILRKVSTQEEFNVETKFAAEKSPYDDRDFRLDLRAVIERLQQTTPKIVRVILLLDEVDVLSNYHSIIQQKLRRLFMESFAQNHLGAVVAGVHISKAWERLESPWYNLFNEIELQPFGRDDSIALLREPVKDVYIWEEDALEFVVAQTQGRPHRLQQFAQEAINHMLEERRHRVAMSDVIAAQKALGLFPEVEQEAKNE